MFQSINDLTLAVQAELKRRGRKVPFNALLQALSKTLVGMPYQALLAKGSRNQKASSVSLPPKDVLLDPEQDYLLDFPEGQDRAGVWIGAGRIAVHVIRTHEGVLVDLYKNGSEMEDSLAGTSLHENDVLDEDDLDEYTQQAQALKPYQVSLHEEPGDAFTTIFECMAEDAEHAYEQAKDVYPGAKLLCAVVVGEAAAAQGMREVDRVAAEQERIAREQLGNYQFGDGLEFLDGQGTAFAVDCDVDRDDWTCKVFVRDVGSAGDGELIALSFHAKFKPSTLQLLEVYALDMALGSEVGARG